jgi:glycopeptide antibiotics resistance protein
VSDVTPVPTLSQRLRRWRMDGVDLVFGEADQRPVQILAAVFVVIWLIVLIWLTGFPSPWSGERGAMVIPAGVRE